jgi:hypothetical protein
MRTLGIVRAAASVLQADAAAAAGGGVWWQVARYEAAMHPFVNDLLLMFDVGVCTMNLMVMPQLWYHWTQDDRGVRMRMFDWQADLPIFGTFTKKVFECVPHRSPQRGCCDMTHAVGHLPRRGPRVFSQKNLRLHVRSAVRLSPPHTQPYATSADR